MKKLTNDEFIEKVKKIHNNKYDYSLVEYKNTRTPIKIICPICGIFETLPHSHIQGSGCNKCNLLTTEKFIKKSKIIHNNYYNYDKVNIINNKTKVIINCEKHGDFNQQPRAHLEGQGCPKCFKESKKFTTEDFINKSNKKHHNLYNYNLSKYIGNKYNIKIICKEHGVFEQSAHHHMNGSKCPKCVRIIDTENFILKANKIHNNQFNYSKAIYKNNKTKIIITCNNHGDFSQLPGSHLQGIGCPICSSSKGEIEISKILNLHNINYIRQKTFDECKNKQVLQFDFYIPEYNICIEYDGLQHFKSIGYFGGEEILKYTKNNDKIKNNYCKNNNIKIIRVKYNENIKEKLNAELPLPLLLISNV